MVTRYSIYAYSDPLTKQLRYIGKDASFGLRAKRINGHYHGRVGNWIKNLESKGLEPIVHLIQDNLDKDDFRKIESLWITYFRKMGCPLTNICDHGDGVVAGYRQTDAHRNNLSNSLKGRSVKPEVLEKRFGRKLSVETRKKLAEAAKKRWNEEVKTIGRYHKK